ncbi:MAG: hypothetical protein ACM3PE_02550, partial [Deltaproteobacteria bacterium]
MEDNEERKRLYDETASMIADTGLRGQISGSEMSFLLSLLDQIMIKRQYPEMASLLRIWINSGADAEIDPIIKETLINMDFKDCKSIEANLDI